MIYIYFELNLLIAPENPIQNFIKLIEVISQIQIIYLYMYKIH